MAVGPKFWRDRWQGSITPWDQAAPDQQFSAQ